jgi:hypothetical protein
VACFSQPTSRRSRLPPTLCVLVRQMTDALNFISNNALVSAIAAAAIVGLVGWLWRCYRNSRDSKLIYNFLLNSTSETEFSFRSTEAIASDTKISESRVAELCIKHPKIKRNEKEKQSWRLVAK